jgi:predicted dehydrogenase
MTLRLCLVGCGSIASHHLEAIACLENKLVEVSCIVDPNPDARNNFALKVRIKTCA